MRNEIENAKKVIRELNTMPHKQVEYPAVIDDVKVFGKMMAVRVKKYMLCLERVGTDA